MTKNHRRPDAEVAQGGLLDDPGFLTRIIHDRELRRGNPVS